eukprot:9493446-Pyramimonas_sp.AAC.1
MHTPRAITRLPELTQGKKEGSATFVKKVAKAVKLVKLLRGFASVGKVHSFPRHVPTGAPLLLRNCVRYVCVTSTNGQRTGVKRVQKRRETRSL